MNKKKRIYISGQITGLNIATAKGIFEAKENELREQGHVPVNPMKEVSYHPDLTWEHYMKEDIKLLCDCDAIFMLSNWRNSKGARIELFMALELGLEVLY